MEKEEDRRLILETMETLLTLQLRSVRQLLNKDETSLKSIPRRGVRRQSLVDLAVQILASEQHPIHVDDLVELLRQRCGRVTDRDSLSSALAKKARQGILVHRIAPATFALRQDS